MQELETASSPNAVEPFLHWLRQRKTLPLDDTNPTVLGKSVVRVLTQYSVKEWTMPGDNNEKMFTWLDDEDLIEKLKNTRGATHSWRYAPHAELIATAEEAEKVEIYMGHGTHLEALPALLREGHDC